MKLNTRSGSFRYFLPHWNAALDPGLRRNPMAGRFLAHNFLLWDLPFFEAHLPRIVDSSNLAIVVANERGHESPAGSRHAADFAEYAYLYERAWTAVREVRPLLAHIPTFLMLDDHEATDDWNVGPVVGAHAAQQERCAAAVAQDPDRRPGRLLDLPGLVQQGAVAMDLPTIYASRRCADAQATGRDALPDLRRYIHANCFAQEPPSGPKATFQTGLGLDWHYRLPFDPPFLVPDCRTRKFLVETDETLRIIDHDDPARRPMSQTIDSGQLDWMRKILVKPGGPSVAFIAPSTPLLMQKKVMEIMTKPETTAEAWDTSRRAALGLPDLPSLIAGASGSTALGEATNTLLRVFQRAKDLEHPIRDKSWRDLWDLADAMRQAGSATKTLVLVSGDVHHNYCMTGNLSGSGRPKPEFLQITCSGLQTTIRSSFDKWLAKELGNESFNVGKRRLVPGFMFKNRTGNPDLALFHNAVAFVEVSMGAEVGVRVRYLSGADEHVYRYTSGAAYMRNGEPTVSPWQDRSDPRTDLRDLKRQAEWAETEPREDDQADALTVAIVIDQPSATDDRFRLSSDDGAYSRTLGAADAETLSAGAKVLRFKVPSAKKTYTLVHQRAKGSRQTIFRNRRVQDLTKAGTPPQTARYGYARLDSQPPSTLPDLAQDTPTLAGLSVEDPEL